VFRLRLARLGLAPDDVHAYLASWNYPAAAALGVRLAAEHFPASLALLLPSAAPTGNLGHVLAALRAPPRLGRQLGMGHAVHLVGPYHHDSHAAFSYAVSPFARDSGPVLVTVLDGYGAGPRAGQGAERPAAGRRGGGRLPRLARRSRAGR
jgi:predicted NodU family carbamoyl transferase